ncbi:hypothetical protein llap_6815 [Limosa lapponica baueri]|uniref:Uncharacterized protein n=1 Tax=Limosa lapponica baueri TaxID=1758121 RepID=A0A2I0U9Y8_LIMLA|nr:hypothetical protein llap_6815 [Limosa lapponica baueri]
MNFENSVRHINATLDVLPVKGPQSPPLPAKTDDLVQHNSDAQQTWAVKPECLTLASPSIKSYLEMENKGDEDVKWNLSSLAPPYVKDVDETGSVYRVTYSAFRCSRVSGTLEAYGEEKIAVIFLPRDKGDYSQFWDLECHPVEKPTWKHKIRFQLSGAGTTTENETLIVKASASALKKTELPVIPEMEVYSEAHTIKAGSHHYINVPVQFKPKTEGTFEDVFVVMTKYGSVNIRLCGTALEKKSSEQFYNCL